MIEKRDQQRIRAVKRKTGGGLAPKRKAGPPVRATQGQRKASRGGRLRQRRT
jgi:hypothetical protein